MTWIGPDSEAFDATNKVRLEWIDRLFTDPDTSTAALRQLVEAPSALIRALVAGHRNFGDGSARAVLERLQHEPEFIACVPGLAANTDLSGETYQALYEVILANARIGLTDFTRNPSVDFEFLLRVLDLTDGRDAFALTQHQLADAAVLREAWHVHGADPLVALSVRYHPNCPAEILRASAHEWPDLETRREDERVERRIKARQTPGDELVDIARHCTWRNEHDLLLRDDAPEEALVFLLERFHPTYRVDVPALAEYWRHPNCPRDLIDRSVDERRGFHFRWRGKLASAPRLTPAQQALFAEESSLHVRAGLASNSSITRDLALELAGTLNTARTNVLDHLAANPGCPDDLLLALLDHAPHDSTRALASVNTVLKGLRTMAVEDGPIRPARAAPVWGGR